MTFEELHLIPPILNALRQAGYREPTPIQQAAVPPVLEGRDLLGCAQTGTGKTAAFAVPILQILAKRPAPKGKRPIRSLVLTPTRELALQIYENFEVYGKHLGLRTAVVFGGVGQAPQVEALEKGVDVLVATPGRLNDLIGQGYVSLADLEIFVLDEADRMLDMGFIHDVRRVIDKTPEKKQTLLFSATMPPEIQEIADRLLHDMAVVQVAPPATTVEKIRQYVYFVDRENKRKLLAHLLANPELVSVLVFTRTKHGADRVARDLSRAGFPRDPFMGTSRRTPGRMRWPRSRRGAAASLWPPISRRAASTFTSCPMSSILIFPRCPRRMCTASAARAARALTARPSRSARPTSARILSRFCA